MSPRPYNLVAELTYRCPLHCPYCSNPVALDAFPEALSADDWSRVFREATALGVVHVGLSGGEPAARSDLAEIVAHAHGAGLYPHLVTAGVSLDAARLGALCEAGLRSVQLSLQDVHAEAADALAGGPFHARKLAFAALVRAHGLPLTLNVVLHRRNLARVPELIELARGLDAERLELANVQLHGWALRNRAALLPDRAQLEAAARAVATARRAGPRPEILWVLPDHFAGRPKPCMGGWGRRTLVVTPDGRVLPCHGAAELPGLEFWRAPERGLRACWEQAPGMDAFRGEDWMEEPCRGCPERERDFGGCRCQAFALTGRAAATDPACALSPEHDRIRVARQGARDDAPLAPRRAGDAPQP